MMQIELHDTELIRRLKNLIERDHKSAEEVLKIYIPDLPDLAPVPQLDPDEAVRIYRRSLYADVRAYWRENGDSERAALTDEQLDEQFWGVDQDGIPRLYEDEGKFEIPPSSGVAWARAAHQSTIATDNPITDYEQARQDIEDEIWARYQAGLNDHAE